MKNSYVGKALTNFRIQNSPIIELFFADSNIDVVQKKLARDVYRETGQSISRQSCSEIFIVMSYVFANNAKHYTNPTYIHKHVQLMNELVLGELVPMVSSNVKQYVQYIKDISTLPVPIDHGQSTSIKGNNSLKLQDPF